MSFETISLTLGNRVVICRKTLKNPNPTVRLEVLFKPLLSWFRCPREIVSPSPDPPRAAPPQWG